MRAFCAVMLTIMVINAASADSFFQIALWLFMIRKIPFWVSPKIFRRSRSSDPDAPGDGKVAHLSPHPGHRIFHFAGLHLPLHLGAFIGLALLVLSFGPSIRSGLPIHGNRFALSRFDLRALGCLLTGCRHRAEINFA